MRRAVLIALAMLALSTGIAAQAPPPGEQNVPPPPVIVANFLSLSDAQQAQFRQLMEARGQASQALGQQMQARHQQLEALFGSTSPDPAAIGRLILEIRALQQQAEKIVRRFHDNFVQMLTAEQRAKMAQVEQAAQLLPAISAFVAMQLVQPERL